MKIMTVGGATKDVFIHQYNNKTTVDLGDREFIQNCLLLQAGAKIEVADLTCATGGGATNTAVSFKRLGFDVIPFFKYGHDAAGYFIAHDLTKHAIDYSHACQTLQGATGISFIIPLAGGDRTLFAFRGVNEQITSQDIPWGELAQCDAVYITSLGTQSSEVLLELVQRAKQHNLLVIHNPGGNQLEIGSKLLFRALSAIDVFIVNSQEAQQLLLSLCHNKSVSPQTRCHRIALKALQVFSQFLRENAVSCKLTFDVMSFFTMIMGQGPRIVVVTDGMHGVYVATPEAIYFHPSMSSVLVNALGAGDAFGSAFVASLMRHQSVQQAIVYGVLNSASVVRYLNAKEGLLTYEQLEKTFQTCGLNRLRTFT